MSRNLEVGDDGHAAKRPRRQLADKATGYYDEVRRRGPGPGKAKRDGDTVAGQPTAKRQSKPTAERQIVCGRTTLLRVVGDRYDMDDGAHRAKRRRDDDDEGERAQLIQRLRSGRTEYDDGG